MLTKIKRGFKRLLIKPERNLRWLLRKRVRDSGLLFSRDNIRIDREIEYYDNYVCAYIEVWFDAERKFGLKLGDENYVNVYAYINPDTGKLFITYVIYYGDGFIDNERKITALTQEEKNLIITMVNEVSLTETGLSVNDNWNCLISEENLESIASRG